MDCKMGFSWERTEDFQWNLRWGPVSAASWTPSMDCLDLVLTQNQNPGEDSDLEEV
jgi:hypothetical protein